ncbi:MAG: PLP-dependent aspartate aminotransferase family protein [Phycisphaerales bacterium]
MDMRTKLIHAGFDKKLYDGASSVPVFQASTFHQPNPLKFGKYCYARVDNPTRHALETAIAELEGAKFGFAFASGIAAVSSVLMLFQPGDHLVVGIDIYGGTYQVLTTVFKQWGLQTTFVDSTNLIAVKKALTPRTKAIIIETPSNPILKITDLAAISKIAHENKILAITDNTFMTPFLQKPLDFNFDIVIHSATKYIGGHSDIVAGLAVTNNKKLAQKLRMIQIAFGAILGPQDCWLAIRGLKTLAVRINTQQESAQQMALWLLRHPKIKKVYYPGLKNHPGRDIHFKQAKGPGAMIAFELKTAASALKFLRSVKIPLVAVSLGSVESILSYPVVMSHAAMSPKQRRERGVNDSLIRFSVGLESVDDLKKDFANALKNR